MTHCFLWRNLEYDRGPETFAMQVVNFGDRPSATIAMVALRKTAEMFTTLHRERIAKSLYLIVIWMTLSTVNRSQ